MISVQGRGCPRQERSSVAPSVTPSVAPSIASLDSFPSPKSKISKQPEGPPGPKFPADTSISKYSENDLQRILKAVLEAQDLVLAPICTLVLAPVVSKVPWEKLKARSSDVYCGKSLMDCYNFCQQCEDYFATAGAIRPT